MDSRNGLGKLLPRSLSKRRRKSKKDGGKVGDSLEADGKRGRRGSSHDTTVESDGTNSINNAEDDGDGRSFGSLGSSTEFEQDRFSNQLSLNSRSGRPAPPSAHPSLIGYLTTSSPVVQAQHLDSQTQIQVPKPSQRIRDSSSAARSHTTSTEPNAQQSGTPATESLAPDRVASSDRLLRGHPFKIATEAPTTPPAGERPAPVIINTPPSPVDVGKSVPSPSPERRAPWSARSSADGNSPTRTMSVHRRSKSGSSNVGPSKLSSITSAPLTPTPENTEQAGAAGFFSSVFSAAQNAANSLSSNIPGAGIGIGGSKKTASVPRAQSSPASELQSQSASSPEDETNEERSYHKNSAVRTLGSGELSLSQLGLAEPLPAVTSPANIKFPDIVDARLRSESAPVDSRGSEFLHDDPSNSRPRSLIESQSGDDGSSQADIVDVSSNVQRTSSLRSALKPRRKRGSSVTTGATVGAAVAAAITSPNSIAAPGNTTFAAPKLTGFAIASKKRNRDFHSFFKSVPDDDYLIEDYSCALQREILAHGRLYVSEGHLCFSSNILGWTTTLVMSFDEIVSVEKRSTALVFKNGLMISTLHAKHIFASFTSRDATYDLIVNIWKLGHPTLKSTLNGVQLEGTGGDKTEKVDDEPLGLGLDNQTPRNSDSEEDSEADDDDEFYDEEEADEIPESQATETSGVEGEAEKAVARKVSSMTANNGPPVEIAKDSLAIPNSGADFPGPAAHSPTDCGDAATHFDKLLGDEIIQAPLGQVYTLVFGPSSPTWMTKWLSGDQKCFDIQMEDKKGLSLDNPTRTYTYIKPLYASLGPKQTKCIVSETLETLDFEKSINFTGSTQTPDVPSGNVFAIKTKYCLSWAENNATRFQINCTVEWSGKSWLKGPIEKGVSEGQGQYCRELFASLKSAVSSRQRSGTLTTGTAKLRKRSKRNKANISSHDVADLSTPRGISAKSDWGLLEPVRGLLEPILDVLKPIFTGNIMYGLLVGLLVASWFQFGSSPAKHGPTYGREMDFYNSYRLAAYEEMWRREDSELWDWLEERAGLDRLNTDSVPLRKRAIEPRTVEERLRDERLDDREVKEAIRITEEKLKVLKEVVDKSTKSRDGNKVL